MYFCFNQVLGYLKRHGERALFSVKTQNNRTPLYDSPLQHAEDHCNADYPDHCSVVVCLLRERVYNTGSRIQQSSDNTTVYYLLLYPHTMPTSERVVVCLCYY